MMTKNKTTVAAAAAFKRSRKSPNVTPLTRQVMTKSIHRAILEYQHTQSLSGTVSPKSPLDLRVRAAGRNGTPVKCLMKTEQRLDQSVKINSNGCASASMSSSTTTTTTVRTTLMNTQDHGSRLPNTLETVYEQEKDANSETFEQIESKCGKNANVLDGPSKCEPIAETPIPLSRRKSSDTTDASENSDSEVWYTPKEFIQTDLIEKIEVNLNGGPNFDIRSIF